MKKALLFCFLCLGFWFISINQVIAEGNYSAEFQNAYKFAYKNGITTSNSIDKAKMNSPLTRIAMAKMLSNYAINILGKVPNTSKTIKFDDVTEKQNANYGNAVNLAYQLWIMWQWTNKFRPNDEVTRAEFATALSRMLYSTPDGKPYYSTHLRKLKQEWIITNDNPKIKEKRWYVMLMLMRSQNTWTVSKQNNTQNTIWNNTPNNSNNNSKDTSNDGKYLTKEEVQKIIEKEEWLKEGSLDSRWYECSWEKCSYKFSYSTNWKEYIYNRENTTSAKTEKIQDLWINNAEEVALKDAKVSKNNAEIEHSFSSDWYNITITTKNNVFIYSISLDWKIEEKKTLITGKKALETVLKEVKLEQSQSDIEKGNKEICSLSYSFFGDDHDMYHCSFTYWWKQYLSYINAHDWSIIPIKKTGSSIQYWKSVTWKENVIISESFTYIDSDKAEELLIKKYNIKWWSSRTMKVGEGENAIYVYSIDNTEYYIDAINWTKMNSKEEIISAISKDSWVSKTIIKKSKKDNEERESVDNTIIELNYSDEKTKEVCSIYSFTDQWTTYTYKMRNIDWKILDSKKEADIWKDKAIELAKQTIKNKYSIELNDDYEDYNRSRAYIRYLENSPTVWMPKAPSKPEYIICFSDKSEKNTYRVILWLDGNIISEDKASIEEMGFLWSMYYTMWYSIDEINELKNKPIEIWGSFSL